MIAPAGLTGSAEQRSRLMTGALKKNLNGSGPKKPMPFAGAIDGGE